MKMKLLLTCLLAAGPVLPAAAAALGDGKLSLSGFGTLAAAQSDTDEVQFARYNQKAGVGDSPRIGLDSNLGLQASVAITPQLSATLQALTRKSTSQSFTTDLTWGFLKYRLDDETSVRLGRMVLPAFLISDYQNVGYANTMMRPPVELYSQEPLENMDGADLNWQRAFGDTSVTLQAFAGKSKGRVFAAQQDAVGHYAAPVYGVSVAAEHGWLTLRAAHLRAKVEANDLAGLGTLADHLLRAGFAQLAGDITLKGGKHMSFTSLGLIADRNNIVLQAEYARRRAQDPVWVPQTNAWYAMAGYRMGKLLPYYAHAHFHGAARKIRPPALPPALAAPVDALLASAAQSADLLGVRWDFAESMALKVQWDRVKPGAKAGALINGPAVYRGSVNVLAAGVDFVF